MRIRSVICHAALALALGLAAAGCQDEAAKLAEHRERGETYLEEEEWPEAVIEFRNMLQLDPNDAGAHYGLAKALLAQKDLGKAYWELQETVRLDPANTEAQVRYGQFLLFGKEEDLRGAVETADKVLAQDPESWEALLLKARALEALREIEEADVHYSDAVEMAPDKPQPLLLYANFLRGQGEFERAEPLFLELTEIEPGYATWAAYGAFLSQREGRDEEAEAAFRKALEVAEPDRREAAYSALASYYYRNDRYDEAEALLRGAIEEEEDSLNLIYLLARFYHARGDRAKADAMIEEATRERPDSVRPLLLLSSYRGRNGDLEGALAAAERALEVDPESVTARLRKAEVLVDLGYRTGDKTRSAEGRAVVDVVLAQDEANPEALFVRAKIDLAEGKTDDAIAALRRTLDARPDWSRAHFLLGSTLFLSGDRTAARASLVRSLELDPNLIEAQKVLTRVHASLGDHSLAIETGLRVLEVDPGENNVRVVVAQSLVRERKLEQALEMLEQQPEGERNAESEYAMGRVYALLGDRPNARKHLLAALEERPARYEILRALLDLDVREGRLEESAERIQSALRARPDDARLNQLYGEVSLYTGQASRAEESFRRAIELNPNDLRAYQSLARYLAVTGRPTEVLRTYEVALDANPRSATLHLIVGSLYELQGKQPEAMERYESAVELDPKLAVAKNNLAYLLAETGGNLDRALDLAQEAKALLPDNPNTADTLGWVLYKKDVPSAAIGYLREAVNAMPPEDPQLALVRYHLALAYEANSEPQRAREVLEEAIKDLGSFQQGDEPRPDPPWAADIRGMHQRLSEAG